MQAKILTQMSLISFMSLVFQNWGIVHKTPAMFRSFDLLCETKKRSDHYGQISVNPFPNKPWFLCV